MCRHTTWKPLRKAAYLSGFAAAELLSTLPGFAAELLSGNPEIANTQVRPVVVATAPLFINMQAPVGPPYYITEGSGRKDVVAAALPADTPPPVATAPKPFDGLNFGAGVAMSFGQQRVAQAALVNNIVRVTEAGNVTAGIVFESHYFFVPNNSFFGFLAPGNWGHGPFVAVDASTSNGSTVVGGVSMGYMIGFRRVGYTPIPYTTTAVQTVDNHSWNFGVGVRVDPQSKVLGDGIIANQHPPPGETSTAVRLKTVPRTGVMLLTSFSF
jgi:hypothetical protein